MAAEAGAENRCVLQHQLHFVGAGYIHNDHALQRTGKAVGPLRGDGDSAAGKLHRAGIAYGAGTAKRDRNGSVGIITGIQVPGCEKIAGSTDRR